MLLKYYLVVNFLFISILFSDEGHIIYYNWEEGPNLISFPILTDNNDIEIFFTSDNANIITNFDINQNISYIISEGEFGILKKGAMLADITFLKFPSGLFPSYKNIYNTSFYCSLFLIPLEINGMDLKFYKGRLLV